MTRLTVENIDALLQQRLQKTVELSEKLDMTNTDIYNIVYFRLYFDFSTAIENTIGNILYEKYGNDDFIMSKSKINSEAVSKYISKDEIKLLIRDFEYCITVENIMNEFAVLSGIVKEGFYRNLGIDKNISELEDFTSFYFQSRDTRNKLAHGLTLENVKFDNKTLFKFMASYCVIKKFYENISC